MADGGQMSRLRKMLASIVAVLTVAILPQLIDSSPAQAVSVTDFKAGNIIEDSLFYNGQTMNATEVQSFLNGMVPECLIGTKYAPGSTTNSQYPVAEKCLKDFRMTTQSKAATGYCSAYVGKVDESAAQIIAKVGEACGISQKVLLVMLEKEQSLIRDDWPTTRMYNFAMGLDCPDSGPGNSASCNTASSGFFQQVYGAAHRLKYYAGNPDSYRYKPFQMNTIQWHTSIGCGTSQVYIENRATAALYIYTPYRPNAASLAGTPDACSTFGNRNFFNYYTSWFGSTYGVSHAHLDSAKGEYNGIRVSGWARKLTDPGTAYVWVNLYNSNGMLVKGQPIAANRSLSWYDTQFPGWGNSHGFNDVIDAAPGTYTIRIYNSSVDGEHFDTRTVTVPIGQGHVDAVTQTVGGIRVQGWSIDFRKGSTPDTIKVTLDGKTLTQSFQADVGTNWLNALFPGLGNNHAFDFTIPASSGTHSVCVYGAAGLLSPCAVVTLISVEHGSLDTVYNAEGGARVTGWALDLATANPSTIKVTVDGKSTDVIADKPLGWFNGLYPGAGNNHGFDALIPVTKSGTYEFCILGTATNKTLSCKTASIQVGEGTSFDSATATPGEVQIKGWSAIFGRPEASYIWVDVNGIGAPYKADRPLSWFDRFSPGSGNNHGFDVTIPLPAGTHQICVYGAATGTLSGCKSVQVPHPQENGHLDGVEGGSGALRAWGWSHLNGQPASSYVWIDINGVGNAYRANAFLGWFNSFAPGQGNDHGFDVTIPANPGSHQVCVFGADGPTPYGCRTITVL